MNRIIYQFDLQIQWQLPKVVRMKGILEERGRVNGRLFLLMRFVFPAKNVIRSTMYEIVFTVTT